MNFKKSIIAVCFLAIFNSSFSHKYYERIVELKKKYLPNPEYYRKHFPDYIEGVNPYELKSLMDLEIREQIKRQLQKDPLFLKADRLILTIISTLLAEAVLADEAIKEWHIIPKKLERSLGEFTKIQRAILEVPDQKIVYFFTRAKECRRRLDDTLSVIMKKRILEIYSCHDRHQCDQTASRSIGVLKKRNIKMSVDPNAFDFIKNAYGDNPHYPILEQLKNHEIFNIGSFDGSKGAFIVHDIYDHFWFSMKLEDIGLFKKYYHLMFSLGNPHISDVFSREGELIATIATHFRWFHFAESDYKPLFSLDDIITILEHSKSHGTYSDNQAQAYALIKSLDVNSKMSKALPFILSDMSLQMLKYITLNGYPKNLDELGSDRGCFDPLDPEHVAFVIEATHYLFDNYEQSINVLHNVAMWIENYLVGVVQGIESGELVVDLDEAEVLQDGSKFSGLSAEKISWMKKNIGFEVVRYPVGR